MPNAPVDEQCMLRGLLAVRNACAQACWHVDESGNSAGMATTSGDQFNALLEMPPSAYRAARTRDAMAGDRVGVGLARLSRLSHSVWRIAAR